MGRDSLGRGSPLGTPQADEGMRLRTTRNSMACSQEHVGLDACPLLGRHAAGTLGQGWSLAAVAHDARSLLSTAGCVCCAPRYNGGAASPGSAAEAMGPIVENLLGHITQVACPGTAWRHLLTSSMDHA